MVAISKDQSDREFEPDKPGRAATPRSSSNDTAGGSGGSGDARGNSGGKGKIGAVDFDAANERIIAGLDVLAEYRSMGVNFSRESPRANGVIECYAIGREESKPSAMVNVQTGRYIDKGGSGENLSIWDFAAKYGGGKFNDWQSARKHFAEKAGVDLKSAGKKPGRKKAGQDPNEVLEFAEWTPGNLSLAEHWCNKHKPGASVEAIRYAGGRIAYWPCFKNKDTGEKVRGRFKCIALPAYGPKMTESEPVAWVLYNINGQPLERYNGKEKTSDLLKMLSVGPTRGAMMGRGSLLRLATDPDSVAAIYKTGGPSDMLALIALIPPEQRDSHLVVTNASSETGDVLPWQVSLFAGRVAVVVHDADEAGEIGAVKWTAALAGSAAEVFNPKLPYEVRKKGGLDLRDWANGVSET